MIDAAILKRCIDGLKLIADTLGSAAAAASQPALPEPPEPPPRRLRQSEQVGVDMARLGREAAQERASRPLPRSPEECRRMRCY